MEMEMKWEGKACSPVWRDVCAVIIYEGVFAGMAQVSYAWFKNWTFAQGEKKTLSLRDVRDEILKHEGQRKDT